MSDQPHHYSTGRGLMIFIVAAVGCVIYGVYFDAPANGKPNSRPVAEAKPTPGKISPSELGVRAGYVIGKQAGDQRLAVPTAAELDAQARKLSESMQIPKADREDFERGFKIGVESGYKERTKKAW